MTDYYESIFPGLNEAKESISAINRKLAFIRLILFVAVAGCVIAGFAMDKNIFLFAGAAVALVVFIIVCVIHSKSKYMELLLDEKIKAAERYINRGKGDYSKMVFDGSEFKDNSHPFAV